MPGCRAVRRGKQEMSAGFPPVRKVEQRVRGDVRLVRRALPQPHKVWRPVREVVQESPGSRQRTNRSARAVLRVVQRVETAVQHVHGPGQRTKALRRRLKTRRRGPNVLAGGVAKIARARHVSSESLINSLLREKLTEAGFLGRICG